MNQHVRLTKLREMCRFSDYNSIISRHSAQVNRKDQLPRRVKPYSSKRNKKHFQSFRLGFSDEHYSKALRHCIKSYCVSCKESCTVVRAIKLQT